MSRSSPEGIILGKGSKLVSFKASIDNEVVVNIEKGNALEKAISLLKQTTEYEVLESFREKVKNLEQFKNK
jgi:hypothetical protein